MGQGPSNQNTVTTYTKPATEAEQTFGQPHELTTDWSDHNRAKDFQDTRKGTKHDTVFRDFSGRESFWGNDTGCNIGVAFTGDQLARASSCQPNEDGKFREDEMTAGYFKPSTHNNIKDWTSDPTGVNQDSKRNPWGDKTPLESGCMAYAIAPNGAKEYACPIEFIAHGWDWQDISEATKASTSSDGTYQRSKQKALPCPKGYVWVENGGIHYVDPNKRIPPSEMLAMICVEDKKLYEPTKPVKPDENTPIYGPDAPVDKPLPPVIGGDCQAFLKSNGVNAVTCLPDGKLPDPSTTDGKKWWEGYDNERIKEKAAEEGTKDADSINFFHYQPTYWFIGAGAASTGLVYWNSPSYGLLVWAPLVGAPVLDVTYQYLNFKLWRAEDEFAKMKDYAIAAGLVAAGFIGPPYIENTVGFPPAILSSVNMFSAIGGIVAGAGYLLYARGFPSLGFL
jgi:hypothetical protein